MKRTTNPNRGTSLPSLLILLIAAAATLPSAMCLHLSANLPASSFSENAVVYDIIADVGGSEHQLDLAASELLSPMGCPSDLFSLQGGVLAALGPLPQAVLEGPPLCVSHINLVAVTSYSCVVRFTESNVQKLVSVVVNILPEPTSLSFPSVSYHGMVLEEEVRAVVTGLGLLQASSVSDFPFSPLQYSIFSGSDNFLVINEIHDCVTIPILVANQSLDREKTASYELVMEAIHPLNTSIKSSAVVRVSVIDINDHSPLFSSHQQTTFTVNSSAEVGRVVGSLNVTDEDSGLNGVVAFHLKVPNQFFSVDPNSGDLFVIFPLTSAPEEHLVTVVATDRGNPPRMAERTFTITIHRVAQFAPTINATSTNVTISEHSEAGTTVTTLQVLSSSTTEPSLSLLGSASHLFSLSLTQPTEPTVHLYSLMVSGDLDRESLPNGVILLVEAKDGEAPSFSSTIVLTVHLEDINDNAPQFLQAAYFSSVFEGSPSGITIITPLTSDKDVGVNADVQFSLIDPPDLFKVDPSTGSIMTAVKIPKGALGSWTLTLKATDQVHSATTTVSISVKAYNMQPPVFTTPAPLEGGVPGRSFQPHATVSVPETSRASDVIYTFLATDADSGCGGRVAYSITLADPPVVQIDEFTGALHPLMDGALDYEQFSFVRVTVRATDNGLPGPLFSEANLLMNIQPANDNSPLIDTVSCPCFLEENSISTLFCRPMSATDKDGDAARFTILAGNELNHFSIHEGTGRVEKAEGIVLNREDVPQYELTIAAYDGAHWSNNVTLVVIVRDRSDTTIGYEPSSLTVRVPIDAELGSTVASLSVTVNDAGFNGLVTYSASSGLPTALFQLDPATADLVVIGNLNVGTSTYSFTVTAQERDRPSNTAMLSVTLSVVPSPKPPSFRIAEDRVTVPQNLQVGAMIAQFMATTSNGASVQYTSDNIPSIFSLSASTGILTLQQPLGVSPLVYRVRVTASVTGQANLATSQVLEITVYSAFQTDNGSPFSQPAGTFVCRYSGEVPEFSATSLNVLTLPNMYLSQSVSYTLESSEHSYAFSLVGHQLQVRAGVSHIFDLTQRETIFITLRVAYGLALFHRCAITVYITDINNHPPTFSQASYMSEIYRNSPMNTIIYRAKATDIDSSATTAPRYALQNADPAFSLDADTGILQLSQSLTNGLTSLYSISLLAIDRENSSLSSRATLSVAILELSNTPPPPPAVQTMNIAEDMPTESQIASVATSDADEGTHGRLNYCLLDGNVRNSFRVTSNGTLLINRPLNFEEQRSYTLNFYIYDSSPNPEFSITTVNIHVADANKAPFFLPSVYKAAVSEDSASLRHIVTVQASDNDTETSRAKIMYSITAGNNNNDLTIDSTTGNIFITSGHSLDRERTDSYQLTVSASNPDAVPVVSSMVQVEVEVVDANDNMPTFNSVSDVVRVTENTALGTVIYIVSANDNDTGGNSDVFYHIVSGNDDGRFALDGRNGELSLVRDLDHETSPNMISLSVEAFDVEGMNSATLQLVVQVLGINEHPPSFTQYLYTASVQENEMTNTIVGQVSAVDYDKDGNTISYSLKGDGGTDFTISSMGVIRTARIIDREQSAYYFLTVTAMDEGTPRRSAAAIVHVVVGDVNDNQPQLNSSYSLSLPEDQPLNVPFFILQATDEDDGQNADVVYSVEPATQSSWGVDPTSGALYLKQKLDFESATSHTFVVMAKNTELPQATARASISINVLDNTENTISPKFPPLLPNILPIPATARVGTLLANLTAVDPDPGRDGEIVYRITGGTGMEYFSIGNKTGEVVLIQPLSSAAVSFLTLEIQISDNSVFPLFDARLFIVNITTPTLPPRFTSPAYHFFVQEGSPASTSVGLVAVTEGYTGHFEDVNYSITAGNQGGTFHINSTNGILSVMGSVNREAIPEHRLQVTATHFNFLSQPAHTLVLVSVLDQNDNRPVFKPSSSYVVNLFNNFRVSPLFPFIRVFSIDPDDPAANGRVTYALQPPSDLFAVSADGNVYLTATVSGTNHLITVRAVDSGTEPLDSAATITVNVVSPNGSVQQPSFSQPSLTVTLQEDASIGTVVHTAAANDGDSPVIMYQFLGTSSSQRHFAIHPNTGAVYVAARLNREMTASYNLNIQAWDGFNTSALSLTVTLADVNDNAPQFSSSSYIFSVSEKALVNTKVGNITASDEDVGPNGQVLLDIVDSTAAEGVFGLAGMDVVVIGPIDREVLPTHYLTVRGRDQGDPPLESYCHVVVEIEDVNNNSPTFSSHLFHLSVNESTSVSHPIATITAYDYDRDGNSDVVYAISPPNSHFTIDESTGELSLARQLDFSTEPTHTLSIVATDKGTTSQSGSTVVSITVVPDFSSPPNINDPGLVNVVENLPPNTMVTSVAGLNDISVAYTLDEGEGYFWIDSKTGVIRTSTPLDRETVASHLLTATVHYIGDMGAAKSVSFTVQVSDVNDNAPRLSSQDIIEVTVREDAQPTLTAFSLSVEDIDSSDNANIEGFVILHPLAAEHFRVESDGQAKLLLPLDVEQSFEYLDIPVAMSDTATPTQLAVQYVHLTVEDRNDESPMFTRDRYSAVLFTPTPRGSSVIHVSATDADGGLGGIVEFSISGGNSTSRFAVNSQNGEIYLDNPYRLQSYYHLEVTATDKGNPPHSSTVDVFIMVSDCPLLAFRFTPPEYSFTFPENVAVNTIIVAPVLIHTGIDARALRFSLHSGEGEIFDVDEFNGTISLRSALDREKQVEHQLAVQARHLTDVTLVADLFVTVTVHDVNDNAPQFTSIAYQSSIVNSAEVGDPVVRVSARDPDLGDSGQVSYHIVSGGLGFFAVNAVTGEVLVLGNLADLQSGTNVTLTVEAHDHGTPVSLSNMTTVTILIVDSQAPTFTQTLYHANTSEAAGVGTHVITVEATVYSGFPTYIIESGDNFNQFDIDFFSGEVTVERTLNYEQVNRYTLLLKVSDPTLPDTSFNLATLEINIVDVNDNSPIFSPNIYSSILPENSTRGTTVSMVTATDLDAEGTDNSRITYAFPTDFPYVGIFTIDSMSGLITLMGEIDYETNPLYEFSVHAIDAGPSRQTGTATVRLSVINVNDNAPQFVMSLFELSVQESAHGGSVVGSVTALDPDLDSVTYSITGGNEDGLFLIDLQTGEIRLSLTGSGFNETVYNLTVSAFDGISYGEAIARVLIADINDNSPVFDQPVYEGTVTENSGSDVDVLQVSATDKDRISGVVLQYSLSMSVRHFKIDPSSGQISTSRNIDREQDPDFEFHVFVTDSLFTGSAVVRVRILDENDNSPVFRAFAVYEAQVKENADVQSTVASVTADDPDEGSNGAITYSLGSVTNPAGLDPNLFPFSVVSSSGAIIVRSNLNFELTNLYTFTIVAADTGTTARSAEQEFTVEVLNVDDTPPVFEQSSYNFTILEEPSDRSIPVGRVVATNDTNAPIDYILAGSESGQLPFGVNQNNGDITVEGFIDREVQSQYLFTVEAYTYVNTQVLKSSVQVTITLLDKNDNRPRFSVPRYQGQVAENQLPNTLVTTTGSSVIQATDRDFGENGTVLYRIVEENATFIINSNGQIFTTARFDREVKDQFSFTVIAYDQGTPSLTSTTFVRATIIIRDTNDEPPVFQQPQYAVAVSEGASGGDPVLTVTATDADLGVNADITYSLQGSPLFEIGRKTGIVTLLGALDREEQAEYNLTIDAYDGMFRDSAQLIVTVTDINDEPPIFNSSDYTTTVEENAPTNASLLSVEAADPDQIGTITYSISVGPSRDNFTINPISGELRFRVPPDYEVAQQLEIQVVATDGVHEVLETVTVYITDKNDEKPSFTEGPFIGRAPENRADVTVIKLSASDRDSGEGGIVTYQIVGGRIGNESVTDVSRLPFRLTTLQSGLIVTTQELDRETVSEYTLIVRASDRGEPSLSSTTTVTVTVLDDNDHSPVFLQPMYEADLPESSALGDFVETVRATDGDSGNNAMVFYVFDTANNSQHFSIDSDSGKITVTDVLDFETQPIYHLTIIAYDSGQVARSGTGIIVIRISDENDNRPIFQQQNYLKIVSEDIEVDSSLLRVVARDQDSGAGAAAIIYSIIDGSTLPEFRVDPNTGLLYVNSKLDFERQRQYQFRVRAENPGDKPLFDIAHINITLTDVNDEIPKFVPVNPAYNVTEEVDPIVTVGVVTAIDPDSVTNPEDITYSIIGGNEEGSFDLDPHTGVLLTKVRFNREEKAKYRLIVTADDGGTPSQTGTAQITVVIDDINDNDPKGGHADIFVHVVADEFIPGLIGQVNANDPDVVNTHIYTILNDPPVLPAPFVLHDNGTIESTSVPATGVYQFEVSVTDNSPEVTCTVTVTVDRIEKEVAERSVTMRVRGSSVQEFLEGKIMPFTSDRTHIFQNNVPGSDPPFVVSVQVVDDVDEITDVSFAVPLSDGSGYVDQELVRHIVHISRSELASTEIGISVETELPDLCVTEPCGANGICHNILTDVDSTLLSLSPAYALLAPSPVWDYQCVCLPGVKGRHCDSGSVDFCSLTPCPSPMTCSNGATSAICSCPEGSRSENGICSVNRTACSQKDCQNGASCVITKDGLSCACPEGYVGNRCQIEQRPPNLCSFAACNAGATCTYSHVGFTCSCPPGLTGVLCNSTSTLEVLGCGLNPCQAGGTCNTLGNGYSCTCPEGYTGANCEVFLFMDSASPSACDSAGCAEEEDCIEVNGEASCLSPCLPNPCLHGGDCVRQLPGFSCDCPVQYRGPRCEVTLASFTPNSFAVFPSIHTPLNGSIYLEFATDVQYGLLFLNGRYDDMGNDHISLELLQGSLKYSLSRGGAEQTVLEYSQGVLSDRQWHSVVVGFNATVS